MRPVMITALMLFSGSCQTVKTSVICAEIRKHEIPDVEMCDVSFKFNRCRCRMFDANSWNAISEALDYPVEHCEGVAGYRLEAIATDIRPNVKALYRLKENLCQ